MTGSSLTITRIDARTGDLESRLAELRQRLSPQGNIVSPQGRQRTIDVFGEPLTPEQVVERICDDIRQQGLPALLDYCRKLDRAELTADSLRVPTTELQAAHQAADPEFLKTVRRVRDQIWEFQTAILQRDVEVRRPTGVVLRQRYQPLERIGICVPGGAAAYPSTVLMTAVPAAAAGVEQIVVVAPPTAFGSRNPDVLATCWELGIREVYRMGGAQAVAALAYGVTGVPPVDKIVGPGNLFVALAKKRLYGTVDIDSIAGPSEVVVIADESTRADFTAADMLAQAEHSPGASILVTWCPEVLTATLAELEKQVARLERSKLTVESLNAFGALILARDEDDACRISNLLAPEHLHVAMQDGERLLGKLRHAGAIFVGNYSPVALGDYVAGPSHVLPTGGTARWAAGLTANHFLRGGSIIQYSAEALQAVADDVRQLANKEGLTAHRASVDIRCS